jgi:hypothetical protein
MTYLVNVALTDYTERSQFAHSSGVSFRLSAVGSAAGLPGPQTFPATVTTITIPGLDATPSIAGALMINDNSGPGDVLRTGALSPLPPSPATLTLVALPLLPGLLPNFPGTTFTYAEMAAMAGTPITINVPDAIELAVAILSIDKLDPRDIVITSITFAPAPGAIDTLAVTFTGRFEWRTFFIDSRAAFHGTINAQLLPSGNATDPDDVIHAVTSGLSLTFPTIPLAGAALGKLIDLVAPLFDGAIGKAVSDALNATIKMKLDGVRNDPAVDQGTRAMLAGAAPNVWRFKTGPTSLAITMFLSKLVGAPVVIPHLGTLRATVSPAPVANVSKSYTITVTNATNGVGLAGASVVVTTFGAAPQSPPVKTTLTTDSHGRATLTTTLRLGSKKVHIGRGDVDFVQLPATLEVSAPGYAAVHSVLIAVPT